MRPWRSARPTTQSRRRSATLPPVPRRNPAWPTRRSITASPDPAAGSVSPLGDPVRKPRHRLQLSVGVAILAVIAVVMALYLARAFFVPLLIGILASYALRPLVDSLKAWRIPRAVGAALVLAALL